jgi:hypothetical protein
MPRPDARRRPEPEPGGQIASIAGGNAFSKSTQLIKILLDAAVKEVVEDGEPALELSVSF